MIYIGQNEYRLGRMIMSHMVSDSLVELHEIAQQLGIRKHFQDKPGKPHYDLCKKNKARALSMGAVEVPERVIIEVLRQYK